MLALKCVIYMCPGENSMQSFIELLLLPYPVMGVGVKLGACLTHAGPWVLPQAPPKWKGWGRRKDGERERTLRNPLSVCALVQMASMASFSIVLSLPMFYFPPF